MHHINTIHKNKESETAQNMLDVIPVLPYSSWEVDDAFSHLSAEANRVICSLIAAPSLVTCSLEGCSLS